MSNKEPRKGLAPEFLICAAFQIVWNRAGLEASRFVIRATGHRHQFSETMKAIKHGRTNYFM